MKEVDPWKIIEKLRWQHKEEIHNQWMPLVAEYRSQLESLQSRLESLEQEMQEQARIIGMGAERELALVAKVESLEKENAQLHSHVEWLNERYKGKPTASDKDGARWRFIRDVPHTNEVAVALNLQNGWVTDAFVDAAMQANKGE